MAVTGIICRRRVSYLIVLLFLSSLSLSQGFNVLSNGSLLLQAAQQRPTSTRRLSGRSVDDSAETSLYLATCIPGLAGILADELSEIHPDITEILPSGNAAVTFLATREASLYALCWVRTAHRLLELVAMSSEASIYDRDDILNFVKEHVSVKDLLGDGSGGLLTVSVKAILNNPRQLPQDLSHSYFTALTVKNALCDVVRELRGDRPNVDVESPDVPLVVILKGTNGAASLTLYRSLHPPGSLHKRGYRKDAAIHKAAMKESLAAGLLREAGWHDKVYAAKTDTSKSRTPLRLVDPMAGSGSFLLEAAMMAADIAPGLMRIRCGIPDNALPPVTRWKSNFDTAEAWKAVLMHAKHRATSGLKWMRENQQNIILHANDIHPGALEIMKASFDAAGLRNLVRITNLDCYDMDLLDENDDRDGIPYFVVTNPPWGVRLTEDIEGSWEGLRHYLRDVCPSGTEACVLSGDKSSTTLLKLKRDRMIPLQTGDQTLRWIHYTIRDDQQSSISNKSGPFESSESNAGTKMPAAQEDSW